MGRTSDARERLMSAMMELIWAGSYGATSVEGICERAGVRKGSFYYFFESKTALAAAALEAGWAERREELGKIFGEDVGPVERLRRWGVEMAAKQREMWERTGRVLGCPLHVLGAEISTQEEGLRVSIEKILGEYQGYVAAAILAVWGGGEERAMEAAARARRVFAYGEGLLTQARIANDPGLLDELEEGVLAIALGLGLGVGAAAA
jgi:TetR/AcrR family transcriptional regulator, transcriptional repressor for nem operon